MGMVRSKTYAPDTVVNGVLLGQPVVVNVSGQPFGPGDDIGDLWFAWDDNRLPSGVLADGEITPDAEP